MNVGSKRREEWENDEYRLTLLTLWRCAGISEKNIAKKMGIQYSTLRKWKTESVAIQEALQSGTEELARQIASSMVKRAKGYDCTEKEIILQGKSSKNGTAIEDGRVVKQRNITKHIPPDTRAAEFLLTNLLPEEWKKSQKISMDGNIKATEDVVIYLPEIQNEDDCLTADDFFADTEE